MPKRLTIDKLIEAVQQDDNIGFCIKCGEEHFSVESDARKYECDNCGEMAVYGALEILFMGVY
jgi:predicted RNA-binding Zn-ribbon protein involved in translation (DUF1610 family)